jgi:hypothetical protein
VSSLFIHIPSLFTHQAKKEFDERTLFLKKQSESLATKEAMNLVALEKVQRDASKEEKEADLFLQKQKEKQANKDALHQIAEEKAQDAKATKEAEQEAEKETEELKQSRAAQEVFKAQSKLCPECSSTNFADAAFCTDCGEKLPPAGELKAVHHDITNGNKKAKTVTPRSRRGSEPHVLAQMASSPRGLSDSSDGSSDDSEEEGGEEGGEGGRPKKTVGDRVKKIERRSQSADLAGVKLTADGNGGGKEEEEEEEHGEEAGEAGEEEEGVGEGGDCADSGGDGGEEEDKGTEFFPGPAALGHGIN